MKLKTGDIFLTDSGSTASKVVKFLMTAPTIWHHLLWKITGRIHKERPRYYHAGMVLNSEQIIEQQRTVRVRPINKIFKKKYIIYRNKYLTNQDKNRLVDISTNDLGEGYGIWECIGKTIAWLTGLKFFARWFDLKDTAICVVRVAEWYKQAIGEDFGVIDPDYVTTKVVDLYCQNNPDEWDIIVKVGDKVINKWEVKNV